MKQNRSLPVLSEPFSWQVHADRWRASGLSRAEYCRQHELSYWAMSYWYEKLVHQTSSMQTPQSATRLPPIPPD